jgi:hypothetical protein
MVIDIGWIIVGILLGAGFVLLYIAYRVNVVMNTLDKHITQAIEEVTSHFMFIVVEKDIDTYYCYRKEDYQFVCQGADVKSVVEAFKTIYPNKTAVIADATSPEIVAEFKEAFKA